MFWRVIYEIFVMMIVVTYAIVLTADLTDHPILTEVLMQRVDKGLLVFLVIEYAIRLWRAGNKREFVKENWFDLVAMIPFDQYFYLARFMRIIRLVRILRASPFLWGMIQSPSIRRVFGIVTMIMLWSSIVIYILECGVNSNINSFADALWWSIVTTTIVGYGDISPVTAGGRIMAAILMLTGIGMLGALTANFATHWTEAQEGRTHASKDRLSDDLKKQTIAHIKQIEDLTDAEYETLKQSLDLLYRRSRPTSEDESR